MKRREKGSKGKERQKKGDEVVVSMKRRDG